MKSKGLLATIADAMNEFASKHLHAPTAILMSPQTLEWLHDEMDTRVYLRHGADVLEAEVRFYRLKGMRIVSVGGLAAGRLIVTSETNLAQDGELIEPLMVVRIDIEGFPH